jgi:hypothetical protein
MKRKWGTPHPNDYRARDGNEEYCIFQLSDCVDWQVLVDGEMEASGYAVDVEAGKAKISLHLELRDKGDLSEHVMLYFAGEHGTISILHSIHPLDRLHEVLVSWFDDFGFRESIGEGRYNVYVFPYGSGTEIKEQIRELEALRIANGNEIHALALKTVKSTWFDLGEWLCLIHAGRVIAIREKDGKFEYEVRCGDGVQRGVCDTFIRVKAEAVSEATPFYKGRAVAAYTSSRVWRRGTPGSHLCTTCAGRCSTLRPTTDEKTFERAYYCDYDLEPVDIRQDGEYLEVVSACVDFVDNPTLQKFRNEGSEWGLARALDYIRGDV